LQRGHLFATAEDQRAFVALPVLAVGLLKGTFDLLISDVNSLIGCLGVFAGTSILIIDFSILAEYKKPCHDVPTKA